MNIETPTSRSLYLVIQEQDPEVIFKKFIKPATSRYLNTIHMIQNQLFTRIAVQVSGRYTDNTEVISKWNQITLGRYKFARRTLIMFSLFISLLVAGLIVAVVILVQKHGKANFHEPLQIISTTSPLRTVTSTYLQQTSLAPVAVASFRLQSTTTSSSFYLQITNTTMSSKSIVPTTPSASSKYYSQSSATNTANSIVVTATPTINAAPSILPIKNWSFNEPT
jgi:hypothetical protein